jgi:Skp family chaperone for outer membrane proteins
MNKLLLVCLLVFAPVSMATADLRIAVIDLSRAFDAYYKTKDASGRLQVKYTAYQKDVQDLITDYQHMGEEAQALDKAANDPTLSGAARQDKATALNAKKQDLVNLGEKIKEMQTERGREFDDEKFRLHQEIVNEISKVINDYAGPQGYDLVIDKSNASAASGVSIVLYNSSKLTDITTDIVTLLNKTAPAGSITLPGAPATPIAPAPASP